MESYTYGQKGTGLTRTMGDFFSPNWQVGIDPLVINHGCSHKQQNYAEITLPNWIAGEKNAIAHQVCQSIKYKEVWGIHGRFKLCEDMQDCSLWELFFVPVFQPLGIIGPYHHYLSATIWIKRLKERKLWVQLLGSRWATSLGSGQLIVFLPQGQASPSLTHCRVMKLVSFPSLS